MANQYKTAVILTGDSSGAVKATKATQAELKKLGASGRSAADETVGAFDRLKSSLFSVQGVITAVAGGAFATMIAKTIQQGDEVQKLSQRLGASTEALSQYRYVAERTGVSFEQLTMGWQRQTRVIAQAAKGTGEAKDVLNELGLSAKALAQLRPEQQFEAIADAMGKVEDQSTKVLYAQKLWDSGNVKLLQSIEGGSKALREMTQRADEFGATITKVEADQMADMNDRLTDMQFAGKGFAQSISTWMIPALSNLLKYLTSASEGVRDLLTDIGFIEEKSRNYIIGKRLDVMKEIKAMEDLIESGGEKEFKSVGGMIAGFFGADPGNVDMDAARKHLFDLSVNLADLNEELRGLERVAGNTLPQALGDSGLGGATDKLKGKIKGTSKEVDTFARELQHLLDKLDPIGKKTRDYIDDVELLNEALRRGMDPAVYEQNLNRLAAAFQASFIEKGGESKQVIKELTVEADPFEQAWVGAIERVDAAFADMWKGAFESFEDFADALKNAFMQLLAELAHAAITRPILIELGLGGIGGVGGTAGSAGGLLNIAGLADKFMGSPLGGALGGLFGIGSMAGGTAGMTSLLGAGGAVGSNFIAGGSGIATAVPQTTGLLSGLTPALPYLGPILAIAGLSGLFGGDEPSPHFGATGGLGGLTQNYDRDLDEQQQQQVTQMIQQMNLLEQAFLAMLTDAQIEALEGYVPPDLVQVHFESEHELAAHMLYRAQEALKVADEELGKAWTDAVNEIWDTRGAPGVEFFTMADYERLVAEIILPQFEAAQEEQQKLEDAAERMRQEWVDWIESMEGEVDAIEAAISELGDLLGGAGKLREKINSDLVAFGGREAVGLEGLAGQVYAELNTSDLDAVRERLDLAEEYRALVVSTYQEQIQSVEQMAQAEKQRVEAIQSAGAVLVRWAQDAMASPALSGIGIGQQPLAAGAQYSTLLAMGRAGDLDSVSRIPGAAQTYLSTLMGTSTSRADYRRQAAGVFTDVGGLGAALESTAYNEEAWRAKIEDLQEEASLYLTDLDENIAEIEGILTETFETQSALLQQILEQLIIANNMFDNGSLFQDSEGSYYPAGPQEFTDYVPKGGTLYDPPPGYYWSNTEIGYELKRDLGNKPPPSQDPYIQQTVNDVPILDPTCTGPTCGMASGGIVSGPSSGYYALLHGTEMITPINRYGGSPINMSEVVDELKALRAETKDLKALSLKNTIAVLKTADTNDKWDRDGMPAERVL